MLALTGGLGYSNGVDLLNDICRSLWSNKSMGATARSLRLTDLNSMLEEGSFSISPWFSQEFTNYFPTTFLTHGMRSKSRDYNGMETKVGSYTNKVYKQRKGVKYCEKCYLVN